MADSTNEAAAVELLQCPFCKDGGTPSVYAPNPHVWCLTCDCAGPHLDTPEEAVAAWNTRAAIAAHTAATRTYSICSQHLDPVEGCAACNVVISHAAALAGEAVVYQVRLRGPFLAWVDTSREEYDRCDGDKRILHPTSAPDVAALRELLDRLKAELAADKGWDYTEYENGRTAEKARTIALIESLIAQQETAHAKA